MLSTLMVLVEARLVPEKRPVEYIRKKTIEVGGVEIIEEIPEDSADFLSSLPSEEIPEQLRDDDSDI